MGLFDFSKKEKKKEVSKKEETVEMSQNGIRFRAVIELLGSPKKYIEDTMKVYIEKIKADNNYKIANVKISKTKKAKAPDMEEEKELFSTFAEVEIVVNKKSKMFDFCFNFMPSSIEVLEPMSMDFSANEISNYLSDIQATLHKVDFALKNSNAANQILNGRLQTLTKNMVRMLRNNIILSLKEKNKDMKDLSKNVGIPEDQLKPFVDNMLNDKEIKEVKGKYAVIK